MPSACSALIATGSPRPSGRLLAPAAPARPSLLLATTMAGLPDLRTRAAKARSSRSAGAGIHQEQYRVRLPDRRRRLRLHPRRQAVALGVFETGGVDHLERQIAELAFAFAPVARHAGLIVDQRGAAAHQAIEQRRLTNIGTADDGDGERHLMGSRRHGEGYPKIF